MTSASCLAALLSVGIWHPIAAAATVLMPCTGLQTDCKQMQQLSWQVSCRCRAWRLECCGAAVHSASVRSSAAAAATGVIPCMSRRNQQHIKPTAEREVAVASVQKRWQSRIHRLSDVVTPGQHEGSCYERPTSVLQTTLLLASQARCSLNVWSSAERLHIAPFAPAGCKSCFSIDPKPASL